jgi:hypothetical protein
MHIEKWEPWFAWHPVRLKDDTRVWLKRVERHYTCGGCSLYAMCWYEYRAPADSASPSAAPQGETPAATEVFELKPYIYLNEQSGAWRYRDSEFKEGRYIPLYRWNEIAKMLDRAAIPAAPVQQASDVLKGGEQ